jgi:hypothetical protein
MNKSGSIRVNVPRGISARFVRNALRIGLEKIHSGDGREKWTAKDHRRSLLFLARAGMPLKALLRSADKNLDERNLWILVRSLARKRNGKKRGIPDEIAIICLDAQGKLTGSAKADSALLGVSPDAYRKKVERLRKIGVRLGPSDEVGQKLAT